MKRMVALILCSAGALAVGPGCGTLRVIHGGPAPPEWVVDPAVAPDYDPENYEYVAGIATYCVQFEDGVQDARHDAICKLAERIGIATDDIYHSEKVEKYAVAQSRMPNLPQLFPRSRRAVDVLPTEIDSELTTTPETRHTSRGRVHRVEQCLLSYTIWRYSPGLIARLWQGESAIRYYDIYVLLRCPGEEFTAAVERDRRLSEMELEQMR